jgi:hypothetical protein
VRRMVLTKVQSIDHLAELCDGSYPRECEMQLAGHFLSVKRVLWEGDCGRFWIENEIDSSTQWLTKKQLKTKTNIWEAIRKGALWAREKSDDER